MAIAAPLLAPPLARFFDDTGKPLSGGLVYTYLAGTTSSKTPTYSDAALTQANENPIRLDSSGQALIYLAAQTYKIDVQNAAGVSQRGYPVDNVASLAQLVTGPGTNHGIILGAGSGVAFGATAVGATNTVLHGVTGADPSFSAVVEGDLVFSDLTTGNVTTAQHGLAPKAPNDATKYLDGTTNYSSPILPNSICEGRLTLSTGVPVPTSDVTSVNAIYFTPYRGNRIALYTGTVWQIVTFSELLTNLFGAAGQLWDVFAYLSGGVAIFDAVAWNTDTIRAVALTLQDGVLVRSGAPTRRYLGSVRHTTAGVLEDSAAKRFVWNYYNRVPRVLRVLEATASWTWSTAAFHQANASTANQVGIVVGVAEIPVQLTVMASGANSAGGATFGVGIKLDGVTGPSFPFTQTMQPATPAANVIAGVSASLYEYPPVGYHFYAWVEQGNATGVTTWYGNNGGANTGPSSGIFGVIDA